MALASVAGDRRLLGYTLDSCGALAEAQGELQRATELHREALSLAQTTGNPVMVAFTLSALASIAANQGQPVHAGRMWGAASALREATGTQLPLEEEARFAGPVAAAREVLGTDAFNSAWEEGRAQPHEQVVVEALGLGDDRATDIPENRS